MMISSSLFLFFLICSKLESNMELEQSGNFLIYRKLGIERNGIWNIDELCDSMVLV